MDINDKILYSQLKALVDLSNQTGIDKLVDCFVFNIKVIFPSKSILLITSHGPKALNRLAFTSKNLYGTVDRLLQRIGSLDMSSLPIHDLDPKTIIKQDDKSSWVQIPINTRMGVIGFLQIAGVHHEKSIFQAEMHIKSFINQVILLSLNERDALTRLYNREAFHEKLSSLVRENPHKRKSDEHHQYVLAFLEPDDIAEDIDPITLDNLLIFISRLIKDTFREYDWAFRYNSRVFAIVLHECDLALAALALGRLNNRIEDFEFPLLDKLTCSIGYTQLNNDHKADTFIQQAKQALQRVQEDGGGLMLSYEEARDMS
jgi:diguanylate cyclase (GGDEF)-like protein